MSAPDGRRPRPIRLARDAALYSLVALSMLVLVVLAGPLQWLDEWRRMPGRVEGGSRPRS
jgi:hypothetical protein